MPDIQLVENSVH